MYNLCSNWLLMIRALSMIASISITLRQNSIHKQQEKSYHERFLSFFPSPNFPSHETSSSSFSNLAFPTHCPNDQYWFRWEGNALDLMVTLSKSKCFSAPLEVVPSFPSISYYFSSPFDSSCILFSSSMLFVAFNPSLILLS